MALSAVRAVQTSEPVKTYSLYVDGKWSGAADGAVADDFKIVLQRVDLLNGQAPFDYVLQIWV